MADVKTEANVVDGKSLKAENPSDRVDISASAKEELFSLVVQAATNDPKVTSFVRGLSSGLGLSGKYFLDFSTFCFVKQKESILKTWRKKLF